MWVHVYILIYTYGVLIFRLEQYVLAFSTVIFNWAIFKFNSFPPRPFTSMTHNDDIWRLLAVPIMTTFDDIEK